MKSPVEAAVDMNMVAAVVDGEEEDVEAEADLWEEEQNVAMKMLRSFRVENSNLDASDCNSETMKTHHHQCRPNSENIDFPVIVAEAVVVVEVGFDSAVEVEGMAYKTPCFGVVPVLLSKFRSRSADS
ncbi:hypothetical protein F0562_024727 [Nyssa sinensis]|uniref:Uncharacterized protein n=1 Tax=Nyssa sinensis TaxID=561372 RepID=A0A5J5BCH3_9ASTE|nr:hypothetical protein F0562_024727 [Nyssa sinensis]